MRKIFITASLIATTLFSTYAQDAPTILTPLTTPIVSKRGYAILPEADDWSLSIDASTSLKFVGQLFSNNDNSKPFSFPMGQTIMVRKFVDANTAYRGIVGINLKSETKKNLVIQQNGTGSPIPLVEDKWRASSTQIDLGVGLEKRKGISRVQGIYGAQAIISFGGSGNSYTYGNAFNNPSAPVSTNFETNTPPASSPSRVLSSKAGKTIGLQVVGFAGVEYFFAPKLSLGGEFNWGPRFFTTGKGKVETEIHNSGAPTIITSESAGRSELSLQIQNMAESLRLNFYF